MAAMAIRSVQQSGSFGDELGAVVAVKPLSQAKSRLNGVPGPLRQDLVWAMLVDTVRVLSAEARTVIVTAEPGIRHRLDDHGLTVDVVEEIAPTGLNQAIRYGERALHEQGIGRVLTCVADLPALRTESLRAVINASGAYPRSFLADADEIGTTMLIANGVDLDPRFGPGSAEAHRASGAIALLDSDLGRPVPDARRDVDTQDDLAEITRHGLGPTSLTAISALVKIA